MSKTLTQFRAAIGFPEQDNNSADKFALGGGLSIEEVAAIGDPAKLLFCKNYEPNYTGGYRSKVGCEPFDGHRQPSAFLYTLLPITRTNTANNPTAIGQIVASKSGAPGVGPFFLGWETLGGIDYIVLSNVVKGLVTTSYDNPGYGHAWFDDVREFPAGSPLYIGSPFAATRKDFATTSGPATFLKDLGKARYYISLARKIARQQILPVGGVGFSGPSRAVWEHNGSPYAIRDRSNDSEACLFVATGGTDPVSWIQLDLGVRVYFKKLTSSTLKEGAIVSDLLTSSTTCTVRSVVIMWGTPGAGDAFGYFVTDAVSGPPFIPNQALTVDGVQVAVTPPLNSTGGGIQEVNKLPANGNYRMKRWNFTGIGGNVRMYGISTVGTAFEIANPGGPGNPFNIVFTPIITGQGLDATTFNEDPVKDTPNRIEISHDQLWLAYPGGNLSMSAMNKPLSWITEGGANQKWLGDDITNLIANINNTMIISTRNRLRIAYGDITENYQIRDLNTEAGAYENTAVPIGGVCFLTDEGISFYDQSANFGNMAGNSLSQGINSLLKAYMSTGAGAIEATIQRDHSFYRLYFDKGVCFTLCIVGKDLKGLGKCEYNLGSTLSLASNSGLAADIDAIKPGDTLTNWDKSESCIVFQRQRIGSDPAGIDCEIITDKQINPERWVKEPLYQSAVFINGASFGIAITADVNKPSHIWSAASTMNNGNPLTPPPERIFFCCEDGYVYEDDTGGAMGIVGNPVDFEAQTQFWFGEQPDNEKYFRRMRVDVIGADAFSNLSLGAEYDDGAGYRNPEVLEEVTRLLSTSGYDQASVYGVGFYGGAGKNVLKKTLHGSGVAISIKFKGSSDIAFSHTVQAVQVTTALRTRRTWR